MKQLTRELLTFSSLLALIFVFILFYPAQANADETTYELLSQFEYEDISFSAESLGTGFIYNDGFFFLDNQEFSPELAKISMALCLAAYDWDNGNRDTLETVLSELADENAVQVYNWEKIHTLEDNDFVRFGIARRSIVYQDTEYVLYFVPIQGTRGGYDWNSNFNIGTGPDHTGFYTAYEEVLSTLSAWMAADGHSAATRIVLTTGHSRGAAVSNILAGKLTEGVSQYVLPAHVFSYNFACPYVSKNANENFKNIYNLNNNDDIVPIIPLEDWGYKRYGETRELSYTDLDNNVRFQLSKRMKFTYAGTYEMPIYIGNMIKTCIPNNNEANSIITQALFRGIAYLMNDGKSISAFFDSIGFFFHEQFYKAYENGFGNGSDGFQDCLDYYSFLAETIPVYLDETEDMETDDYEGISFSEWFELHREDLERMESVFGYNITSRRDLENIYLLVTGDTVAAAALNINATTAQLTKLAICAGDLWFYWSSNGLFQTGNAIEHAHMSETYMLWVNSMYFGYDGWRENLQEQICVIQDNVLTIAPSCFYESPVALVSPMNTVCYIGSAAFKDSGLELIEISDARIANYAFSHCANLENVIVGDNSEIGKYAFSNCSSLQRVEIGANSELGEKAFESCGTDDSPVTIIIGVGSTFGQYLFQTSYIGTLSLPCNFASGVTNSNLFDYQKGYGVSVNTTPNIQKLVIRSEGDGTMVDNANAYYGLGRIVDEVVFQEGIINIGRYMFGSYNATSSNKLKKVSLPSTLKSIGDHAFYTQNGLTEIQFPEGITSIGAHAFEKTGISEVKLSSAKIGASAFSNCSSLKRVEIGANSELEEKTFESCGTDESPVTIIIGEGTKMGQWLFQRSHIDTLSIPCNFASDVSENVYPFGRYSNYYTYSIRKLIICNTGDGAMIDDNTNAYYGLGDAVSEVEIQEGVTHIGKYFLGSYNDSRFPALKKASLPSTMKSIGDGAFRGQTALTQIQLPEGITSIGAHAFEKTGISEVKLSSAKIGASAFSNCSSLKRVEIGANSELEEKAFESCGTDESPVTIIIGEGTKMGNHIFQRSHINLLSLPCNFASDVSENDWPFGFESNYYSASIRKLLIRSVNDGTMVDDSDDWANAYYCLGEYVGEVEFQEGVTHVGAYLLGYYRNSTSSALKKVTLPSTLKSIGEGAFRGQTALTQIQFPEGIASIGNNAFSNCNNLSDVYYCGTQAQWNEINNGGNNNCLFSAKIHYLTIQVDPDFILPASLTEIGDEAFTGCPFIYVKLSENCASIGKNAFANCPNLTYIYIPAATTDIDENAFGTRTTLTVLGKVDSTAQSFAQSHGFTFEAVA